jgi:thioesterase domain-containing protein/acyl carrier protein
MLPDRIVALERLPLTPGGKIDRVALATAPLETAPAPVSEGFDTATETFLREAWAKEFGLAGIRPDDNFFALGGHSLMAVRIFARIRAGYGLDLPISTLYGAQTIRSLADRIDTLSAAPPSAAKVEGPPDMAPWDTTVVVHPGPGGPALPLFIVGGVGGNVNNLHAIGLELGQHRPVIGLQTRGILGHRLHASIEATAADHMAHMRRHHPGGPWLLAGYSGGGFTAFEIARQLVATGETVAFLGVLDMFAPGFSVGTKVPFRTRLAFEWRAIAERGFSSFGSRLSAGLRRRLLTARVARLGERLQPGRFLYSRMQHHWSEISRAYRPAAYDGAITLYGSRADGFADAMISAADPLFGWGRLARDGVRMRKLDAGHLDMLRQPAVHDLAEILEADIKASLAGGQA